MNKHLLKLSPKEFCRETDACPEGAKFAMKYKTMRSVWDHCPRVDWLAWILNQLDVPPDKKAVRLYMVWCARNTPLADGRTTEALLTEPASKAALAVAERFAEGKATVEELAAARCAAWYVAESVAKSAALSTAKYHAWGAASGAAWYAAESAASGAARSAAWSAQADQFRKVVANPFA